MPLILMEFMELRGRVPSRLAAGLQRFYCCERFAITKVGWTDLMVMRAVMQGIRTAAFGKKRRAMLEAAGGQNGLMALTGTGPMLADLQRYALRSQGGDYEIFVAVPAVPPPKAGYPVLTMLDGNAWIAGAAEALNWQGRFALQSEIEPPLIVAVGYPGADPFDLGRRAFDYLPRHESGKLSQRFMQGAPWHQPGGADDFLAFLTGPLRDEIAKRYPVDPARHILSGHSFGGLFALRSFLTNPRSFRHYAALSPSLWWDDAQLMKQADDLIAALPRDLDTRLYIGVGERETPDRPQISARMMDDARAFADTMIKAGPPGVTVCHRVYDGENHQSLPLAAFSAVLRFVVPGELP